MSVHRADIYDQIMAEREIEFPPDFVFKPIEQEEVDDESSLFYSSEEISS